MLTELKTNSVIRNAVWLFERFCHRKDAYTVMEWNERQHRANYYRRVYEPLTLDVVKKHIAGEITVAVFPTDISAQTCRFACYDVDYNRDNIYLMKALLAARKVGEPIVEASGKPNRFHVWVLFDEPRDVREVRKECFGEIDGYGMDFFPNRDRVVNDFFFELPIKLPLGFHRQAKVWSRFVSVA